MPILCCILSVPTMTTNHATAPLVGILMGSDSDWETMRQAADILTSFGVPNEANVLSAHRTPHETAEYASGAIDRGMQVIIAGAGGAAHLAGVIAAHTVLPVIGVPMYQRAERPGLAVVHGADAERHPGRDRGHRAVRRRECRTPRDCHPGDVPAGLAREAGGAS